MFRDLDSRIGRAAQVAMLGFAVVSCTPSNEVYQRCGVSDPDAAAATLASNYAQDQRVRSVLDRIDNPALSVRERSERLKEVYDLLAAEKQREAMSKKAVEQGANGSLGAEAECLMAAAQSLKKLSNS